MSDFGSSILGRILLGFMSFFLNTFLSLLAGVAFNVVSVYQYKAYLRQRVLVFNNQSSNLSISIETARHSLTQKECKERKTIKNMFFMALTLCSLSILTRVLLMFVYIYYFFFYTFELSLIVETLFYSIQTLMPTMAFFVFYSFNKIFLQVFNQRILRKYRKPLA
jgi:hypothetical protein